ncbi:hypothetical protein A2738_00725 [Candidatus Nomurabacteria bacterium RIFCSPHIGHO2_01_FULL_42_15]|uniref:Nmd3 N-terminal domain-containing protein n=1 Tax=Candidatus Nomurabacteria bacterium RIFCSPHIGHO2_01_FULL_42_15 TaxID=1801742 RepID=A0A1F6VFM9_9BACT|nr:MAG: hypothetical protein A2738_00725 [Candidatus Nomurabacteria bacterium RIFCSPHIGHO2_01_FULL_42_15]OGI93178.1 MAG: hypothetical protein A3A99_01445 [Candidatus Nomurabacteria bacterium RIFCSPLOWO2_01_FULL_41_18]
MLKRFKTLAKDWVNGKRKEFPRNKKFKTLTMSMCEHCYAFYYKKSWNFKKPNYLNEYNEENISVHFTKCPACIEQENALFERESSLILGSGHMG